jgi:hypothetical protein
MKRPRLLLVIPAATALVFTGMAPAWAGDGNRHDDDVSARILSIDNTARADDDARYVDVEFRYRCDDGRDREDVSARVTLTQRGNVRYEGRQGLICDNERRTEDVRLYQESRQDVDNGRADVTVRIRHDGDTIASAEDTVRVRGVDDNGHDDKDR